MPRLQVHEQHGETLEVRGVGIRDDVEIPGRPDDAMRVDANPPMMICCTPASCSARSSGSGLNGSVMPSEFA
jgi:hypothetical protein